MKQRLVTLIDKILLGKRAGMRIGRATQKHQLANRIRVIAVYSADLFI
jgi:hypothetical protein